MYICMYVYIKKIESIYICIAILIKKAQYCWWCGR